MVAARSIDWIGFGTGATVNERGLTLPNFSQ
jgi:hypothetical protein